MGTGRFEASAIKNKIKREDVARKNKKAKRQDKLRRRLELAKEEANDPAAKKVKMAFSVSRYDAAYDSGLLHVEQKRLEKNVPRTLDNTREFDPSILTADPSAAGPSGSSSSAQDPAHAQAELSADLEADPFASYFSAASDPTIPPKVLITTSSRATKVTYTLCNELVNLIPGAEFIRRKKGSGFEMGRVAGWAANRGYSSLCVVNEDMKKPSKPQCHLLTDTPRLTLS